MPIVDQRTTFTLGEATPFGVTFAFSATTPDQYIFVPASPYALKSVSLRLTAAATAPATLDILRVPDGQVLPDGISMLFQPVNIGAGCPINVNLEALLAAEVSLQQTSALAVKFAGNRTGLGPAVLTLVLSLVEF